MTKLYLILVSALLLLPTQILAHPLPKSRVDVHILESTWILELQLPAERLGAAMRLTENGSEPESATGNPAKQYYPTPADVKIYVAERIIARSGNAPSNPWAVSVQSAIPPETEKQGFWKVRVALTPSTNTYHHKVELSYYVIGKEIHTHEASVFLAHDYANANQPPAALAKLRAHRKTLTVER